MKAHRPVLLTGPVGTGKTSVAQGVLQRLDPKTYSILTINMSAQVKHYLVETYRISSNKHLGAYFKLGFLARPLFEGRELIREGAALNNKLQGSKCVEYEPMGD